MTQLQILSNRKHTILIKNHVLSISTFPVDFLSFFLLLLVICVGFLMQVYCPNVFLSFFCNCILWSWPTLCTAAIFFPTALPQPSLHHVYCYCYYGPTSWHSRQTHSCSTPINTPPPFHSKCCKVLQSYKNFDSVLWSLCTSAMNLLSGGDWSTASPPWKEDWRAYGEILVTGWDP